MTLHHQPDNTVDDRAALKARLVEAYGGDDNEHAEHLAEAELRHREAKCSHIFCDRSAYEDFGCLASGIPLCRDHSRLVPGLFDVDEARERAISECVEFLRVCEAELFAMGSEHRNAAHAMHSAADGIEDGWAFLSNEQRAARVVKRRRWWRFGR